MPRMRLLSHGAVGANERYFGDGGTFVDFLFPANIQAIRRTGAQGNARISRYVSAMWSPVHYV